MSHNWYGYKETIISINNQYFDQVETEYINMCPIVLKKNLQITIKQKLVLLLYLLKDLLFDVVKSFKIHKM